MYVHTIICCFKPNTKPKEKEQTKKNTQEIQRETEERETKYEYNIIIKIVEMCSV